MLIFFLSAALAAEPSFEQSVVFAKNNDPDIIALRDGRQLRVRYGDGVIQTVFAWSSGRPLSFHYDIEDGMTLKDTEQGTTIPVLAMASGRHLIDDMEEACQKNAISTLDMTDCAAQSNNAWKAEIARLQDLLEVGASPEQKQAYAASRAAWEQHYQAQVKTLNATYGAMDGTIWRVIASQARVSMLREQVRWMGAVAADASMHR
ncbi:MAG: lysozyme inhibitor LprI family protein [Myxococcota bacterium]